jgi:3-phosphoshikimate 1-carboxyvinyltransferase
VRKIVVKPCNGLSGVVDIPGDKSISHRSVIFAGLADTPVTINNFLFAQDCLATIQCMRSLGVEIVRRKNGQLLVRGRGRFGLTEPQNVLDVGNSGTALRLLTGILAGQPFFSVLTGDASLRCRPMDRVIVPLDNMGCRIYGRDQSRYAPLAITPATKIVGMDHSLSVASAQVKSAILLAGLYSEGKTSVTEPYVSRDHTERMLRSFGVDVKQDSRRVSVGTMEKLVAPNTIDIPGDISSAAFWLVAATVIPKSKVMLCNVGINPTRTGIIDVLLKMGADITLENIRQSGEESVADLTVRSAQLTSVTIESDIIPRLIDEIPILALAALFAEGTTVIRGAGELRIKETDRLKAIAGELKKLGANISETSDGLVIQGGQKLHYAVCHSRGDHRMAMTLAIAGLASGGVEIIEPGWASISYPNFFSAIEALR